MYVCVCMRVCIYVYIYIPIQTYIYIYIYFFFYVGCLDKVDAELTVLDDIKTLQSLLSGKISIITFLQQIKHLNKRSELISKYRHKNKFQRTIPKTNENEIWKWIKMKSKDGSNKGILSPFPSHVTRTLFKKVFEIFILLRGREKRQR